jgi:DNA-binding PadR family transcriptional regulator
MNHKELASLLKARLAGGEEQEINAAVDEEPQHGYEVATTLDNDVLGLTEPNLGVQLGLGFS